MTRAIKPEVAFQVYSRDTLGSAEPESGGRFSTEDMTEGTARLAAIRYAVTIIEATSHPAEVRRIETVWQGG
jgi:hypothetical protein